MATDFEQNRLKTDFLELLNSDESFRKEILQILKPKKEKFTTSEKGWIKTVRDYWNETSRVKNKGLYDSEKKDIIAAVHKIGVGKLLDTLDIVNESPLMKTDNVYKKHLQNLGWVVKPQNIDKILSGLYSAKKTESVNSEFDKNDKGFD